MGSDKMAGLPRRIIKVTAQTSLQIPALHLSARQRGCSHPPAGAGRPEAGERVWPGGERSLRWGGGAGRLPAAVGQPRGEHPGLPGGPLRAGEAWTTPRWRVGLWGSGLGRGPRRSFRPPPGGGRGRAGIAAGPGLRAGVAARHGSRFPDPPSQPGQELRGAAAAGSE